MSSEAQSYYELAERLAELPTSSNARMDHQERVDGILQMIYDLRVMAETDGCIAAAWAIEFLFERFPAPSRE